jgi:hypothetical protein
MPKHDFDSANTMLTDLKNSFDVFLKNEVSSKTEFKTDFGKEVTKIFDENQDNPNAKKLDFQYKKIIQIANDIQHLKSVNDETLPDWLEDELESVFKKIKDLLKILEEELN